MRVKNGRVSIKLLIFLLSATVAAGIFFVLVERDEAISVEAGAVESPERATVSQQEQPVVSRAPVVVEFVGDGAFRLQTKDNGEIIIEARVTYQVVDADMASKAFGSDDTMAAINRKIAEIAGEMLKKKEGLVMGISDGSRKRISLMVQIHGALINAMKQNGVRVSGVNIRRQ